MAQIGAEIDQLTALKGVFDRQSVNVSELVSAVDSQVAGTFWVGPAADRFKSQWEGEFKRVLRSLQSSLAEAGAEVARNRDALIAAQS